MNFLIEALGDAKSDGDLRGRQEESRILGSSGHGHAPPAVPQSSRTSRFCGRGRHRPGRPLSGSPKRMIAPR